jgi:hypothetical protein
VEEYRLWKDATGPTGNARQVRGNKAAFRRTSRGIIEELFM